MFENWLPWAAIAASFFGLCIIVGRVLRRRRKSVLEMCADAWDKLPPEKKCPPAIFPPRCLCDVPEIPEAKDGEAPFSGSGGSDRNYIKGPKTSHDDPYKAPAPYSCYDPTREDCLRCLFFKNPGMDYWEPAHECEVWLERKGGMNARTRDRSTDSGAP